MNYTSWSLGRSTLHTHTQQTKGRDRVFVLVSLFLQLFPLRAVGPFMAGNVGPTNETNRHTLPPVNGLEVTQSLTKPHRHGHT